MEPKIDTVAIDHDLLRTGHKNLVERVADVELATSQKGSVATEAHTRVKAVKMEVKHLVGRVGDVEGCSRRNNIRLVGAYQTNLKVEAFS